VRYVILPPRANHSRLTFDLTDNLLMRDNNASLPDRLSRGVNNEAEYNTGTCD